MFGFFKKKAPQPSAKELDQLRAAAREDVKSKWVHFHETVHLQTKGTLTDRIDFFIEPVYQLFQHKYPVLLKGASENFWQTVSAAIVESGTHGKQEIRAVITDLKAKYGDI
jgi:hypothetical protein